MNKPSIKILHLTFSMAIGGAEQVIFQIVSNSDPERFMHEVLCIDGVIGPLGQELISQGIHVESIKRNPGVDIKLVPFIHKLIKRRKINIVHGHQYTPYFYGVTGGWGTGARVIYTEHGRFYPDRHNIKRRFINPLLALTTHWITAISKSTADAVAQYEYFSREKIKVIYNGTRDFGANSYSRDELLVELCLSADYRYIGSISRLEPIKNQTMMIKAFDKVKQQIPGIKLILIGDGSKKSDLERLVKDLGYEKDIIITGYIDNPQKYIEIFEIFLLSSFSEGTSMTLLEAMSFSKPCIVTDVGGNPEVITHNVSGLVIPSDNVELFADAILRLLTDKVLAKKYGSAGRHRFLNNFTIPIMLSSYEKFYENGSSGDFVK